MKFLTSKKKKAKASEQTFAFPLDFLHALCNQFPNTVTEIATDTETSGLFADDGARISTASIAFEAKPEDGWEKWASRWNNVTYGPEIIHPELPPVYILSVAWPFDQGVEGPPAKPEHSGQDTLWPEAENLPSIQWRDLLEILSNHDLVMHNGKFDVEKYRVGVRRWPGVGVDLIDRLVWDTQNVNDLLWRLHPTSLKPTCARLFGQEWADESEIVKKYLKKSKLPTGRWDLIPWDIIGGYADTDARITLMLKLRQEWEIFANGAGDWLYDKEPKVEPQDTITKVHDTIERRLAVTKTLYKMERRGVPFSEVDSRLAGIECRDRAKPLAKKLPFTPTGPAAKDFFFTDKKSSKGVEGLDMVPYSVTDKGAPQLTAEILARMVEDRVPHAEDYAAYTRVMNAASMWYEGYADRVGPDGRIRTAFRQNGTRSSRFSVERLNLQAIPQDYRLGEHAILDGIPTPRHIIANSVPDGWMLYELDLEQAELRVGAMFAGCDSMLNMIETGADLHTYTTKELFPHIPESDPLFHAKWRQVGKRGNFSLGFGSGGKTFKAMVSKETGIILEQWEADKIVRDWNSLYPEFSRAIDKHQRVVAKRQARNGYGWIDLPGGERRWFQEYEEPHKAFNQRVQGSLAQFGIDWMLQTEQFLEETATLHRQAVADEVGEVGLVLTVHDSQILMLPDNDFGRDLADQCAQFGRDLWKQMFPGVPGGVDYHNWKKTAA